MSPDPAPGARRCGVLGRPIAHSLSPVLHRAAYDAVGLDWSYEAHEVGEEGLVAFLDGLDDTWRGLSLTMPLKRSVVPLLDELSDRAAQAQAANTVILESGRRAGHNTDVPGIGAALRERYQGPAHRAVVLGGGATASSAVLALADLGCADITLLVRDPARTRQTLEAAERHPAPPQVAVRALDGGAVETDVLVSTVPAEAQDARVQAMVEAAEAVLDVLYDPWPTPLARAARRTGRTLVSGFDLLVHQAAEQFTLMTGRPAPLQVMREAGERSLGHGG